MRTNLRSVYAMHSIVGLAGSLFSIFIPAYLISLGYLPTDVFLYFLIYAIAVFLFFVLAASIAQYVGLRLIVLASFPFILCYIWMLYALHASAIPLFSIASVQGAGAGLYWFALHQFFIAGSKRAEMGSNVSKLFSFPSLIGLAGPLIGGFVAVRFGFPILLAIGGVVLLAAVVPLLFIPEVAVSGKLHVATFVELFKQFRRYSLVEFFENIREELEAIVWPLFVFITFRSALSVGIIGALAGVGSIIFTLCIGRYTDRIHPKIFMRIGALLMAVLWFARYLSPSLQILFYIFSVLAGLFACLIEVPFTSYIYTSAKENNPTEFLVYREFPVTLARIVIYSVALCMVSIPSLFLIGAAASLAILLF